MCCVPRERQNLGAERLRQFRKGLQGGGSGRSDKAKKSFGDVNPSRTVQSGLFPAWLTKTKPGEASALWKQPAPRRGPDRPSVQMKAPQPHGVLAWSHKQQLTIARKKLRKPHQTSVEDKWLLSKKAQDIVLISPLHEKHEFSRTVMVSLPF